MANTFIKPTVIAAQALGLLYRQIVLPNLVWLNGVGDFAGAYQDTITIRVPARTTARRRSLRGTGGARTITLDNLTETAIPVQLTEDIYHAVPITDEELSLDIKDFGLQILTPQIRSVGEAFENDLAALMASAPYVTQVPMVAGSTFSAIIVARQALNRANVDFTDRVLVVGSAVEAALLNDPQFARFDSTGDSPNSALREAQVGRIAGMDVYTSNAIYPGTAYMFHKSAFIMATRAPAIPDGAPFGSSQSFMGLGMRWLRDYDATTVTDRSIVDSFAGYAYVPDPNVGFVRAVKINLAVSGITINTYNPTLSLAGVNTVQLNVTNSNGDDVTSQCTYTSATTSKATVASNGVVTGVAAGTSVITATLGAFTSTTLVTVTA